jgi:SAM-dependent methyltransferase
VLELGCGSGIPDTRELAARFRVTGVDISPEQIRRARAAVPEAEFVVADITTMSLPAGSYDAVVSFYVFNHIPRELLPGVLAAINSWLTFGGLLLTAFGTTDNPGWTGDFLGAPTFFSSYPPAVNSRFLEEAGFELLLDEVVTFVEPDGPATFQWVLARR